MKIAGVDLEQSLLAELVACGHTAHNVAQAHQNDPGSSGFTFGLNRFLRATELARAVLEDHRFATRRVGTALVGSRDELQLEFAVARGDDLRDPGQFDADTTRRLRVARGNALRGTAQRDGGQLSLIEVPVERRIVAHVVWSGTVTFGMTSAHIGRLVCVHDRKVDWVELHNLYRRSHRPVTSRQPRPAPSYLDQPLPEIDLQIKPQDARRAR